jgi:hypothetical protein
MAAKTTNADLLRAINDMGTRVSALESWKIAEDAAKKAVSEYQAGQVQILKENETKLWIKVLKQVGIILGILIVLGYAYINSRGIH